MHDLVLLDINSNIDDVKFYGAISVGGATLTLISALGSMVQTPEIGPDTLVPLGVVIALFVGTVGVTAKFVKLVTKIETRLTNIEKDINAIQEEHKNE